MRPIKQRADAAPDKSLWPIICREAAEAAARDPVMGLFLRYFILDRKNLQEALLMRLAERLHYGAIIDKNVLLFSFAAVFARLKQAENLVEADLRAVMERDPATTHFMNILLYYKGFQALQTHRIAHALWQDGRKDFACYLQSRSSAVFQTDIHPAAQIGKAVFLDHATGVVIGETTIIEDNVSLLHEVTLGGTGKSGGDRHPKIRRGALIGAGAKILGNIEIGADSKVAANSVIVKTVPPHVTVAGVPARILSKAEAGAMNLFFIGGDGI
ncbi:MAG: serine O-acetyltransferase [Candidatus Tokpelaia sp.]|nr:MAG: serine O-acetyltransferase [Candidatus Tokpelaia sp.]KAA6207662.1 MAG: serine O-acetyltransferase [Candidatus Tokpelaia sp.]